jgi:hypothetical protein
MNDFWNNISRYPRFFISSLIGLILVILTPFRNLFKIKKFRFIFTNCFFRVYFSSLYLFLRIWLVYKILINNLLKINNF